MTNRGTLEHWSIFPVLLLFALLSFRVAAADRPNIVFILIDDLAWSDLACYGNHLHETPNIDRLAKEGIRFTQAYAPAPICSASRAAFLTGKTPARLGFEFVTKDKPGQQNLSQPLQSPPFTLDLPLKELTIGEALAGAGYETGFFGKWHVCRHYEGYLGWSPTHGPLQQGFQFGTSEFGSHPYAYRLHKKLKGRKVSEGNYPKDALTERAVEFIEKRRSQPFFLYLSQYYVHDPVHTRCHWLIEKYRRRLPAGSSDLRAAYAAMVQTIDHLIGQVIAAIDRAGLADETVIILTSDNGGHPRYTSNAPLRGSKWNLYEGGIRVPMIVRWSGHLCPRVDLDSLVHGCDLLPTCCELAGVDPPAGLRDGVSLRTSWRDPSNEVKRRSLVWHFPYYHPERGFTAAPQEIGIGDFATSQTRPHSAIRIGDWKLLHFHEEDQVELYDLSSDIGEQRDLANLKPEKAMHLKIELREYLTRVQARLPSRRAHSAP